MRTTIVLPVSRAEFLQKVFASLERLDCDRTSTRLLVYVDGDPDLFLTARNFVENSKFVGRLCVKGNIPGEPRDYSINLRRRRISRIHNEVKAILEPCDYIFLIEDDGLLPPGALSNLKRTYLAYPYAGFVTGVELGRWGIPHIGAWRADDVYGPSQIESVLPGVVEVVDGAARPVGSVMEHQVEEVDAAGLYCCLAKYGRYVDHDFKPYRGDVFGPDVDWGLSLRQIGYKNYIDWNVVVDHLNPGGVSVHPRTTAPVQMRFVRRGDAWNGEVIGA